jgi:hypothetical protein
MSDCLKHLGKCPAENAVLKRSRRRWLMYGKAHFKRRYEILEIPGDDVLDVLKRCRSSCSIVKGEIVCCGSGEGSESSDFLQRGMFEGKNVAQKSAACSLGVLYQ